MQEPPSVQAQLERPPCLNHAETSFAAAKQEAKRWKLRAQLFSEEIGAATTIAEIAAEIAGRDWRHSWPRRRLHPNQHELLATHQAQAKNIRSQ
jgi:hypothetical protein